MVRELERAGQVERCGTKGVRDLGGRAERGGCQVARGVLLYRLFQGIHGAL